MAFHILIIGDSLDDRANIRQLLLRGSDRPYRFTEASLGAAGLRACRETPGSALPNCVLLDYHLPDMNAPRVLVQLCGGLALPPCPVVVVGGAGSHIGRSVLRAGAQEYIGKSWLTPESLTRAIDNAVLRFELITEWLFAEKKLQESKARAEERSTVMEAVPPLTFLPPDPWYRSTSAEARQELAESYERQSRLFDATLSAITDFVYIIDREGRFLYANRALLNLWGLTLEAAIGKNFFDLKYPDELASKLQRQIQQVIATKEGLSDQTLYTSPTGATGHYEYIFSPVISADGTVEAVAGSTRNITAHKRTETALITARQAAETANQSKDRFLAVLSHELRTPLTPMLMAVAALEHDPGLRTDVREHLGMIKRNIELEAKLIDDLLDLSRITSGKVELNIEEIDLNETVRHVCGSCRSEMQKRSLRLEIELHDTEALVAADSARLQQVLWNVLVNAMKFTPEKGTIRVTTARQIGGRWEVRVQDSGIGIPVEALPRIFDAFEQGSLNVTRQFGGLGLGLAISKALLELHHGSIRAESAGPGQGSAFIIELPGRSADTVGKAAQAPPSESEKQPKMRLLLVEDHSDTALTISRLLRNAGFAVTTASDVASASAAAERESFDLLVSDLGLPDGDGYEIMRRICAIRSVPGIAMSGYGMNEDRRRSREAGFAEHLVKPIDVPQLIEAIRRVTGNRG